METIIREAQESDVPVIISLLSDFAAFENLSEFLTISEEDLHNAMFGEASFVEGLVCEVGGRTAGFAIFYPRFSSFRGQCGYYLEDIYIAAEYRGRGLGEKLLKEIARKGKDRGFERIDFQVLEWNFAAIEFYKALGAVLDSEDKHYKFVDQAFESLAD
ncbi:MAG: GNAT family N-acetyltransferase [bacterium]|nr:GNAT family N-acetyltransferase [bacterium]